MPAPPTYSLSSGFGDASNSPTSKKERVSAQMVGSFVGSKSWASSSASYSAGQPRRPGRLSDQDGRYVPRAQRRSTSAISDDNVLSKAAAWMWHARGSSEITVLPTKLQRSVQAEASINAISRKHRESGEPKATDQITSTNRQPSRFKEQTHNFSSAARPSDPDDVNDQLHIGLPSKYASHPPFPASEPTTSASDLPEGDHDDGNQPSNILYDQFDLLSLRKEVEKLRQRPVSDHGMIHTPAQYQAASSTSFPWRQIKLLSGIQKLFSKAHTSARNSKSGPSLGSGGGPRKANLGTTQLVIHHHHHHFHYHNPALPAPASDNSGHEVVARRRRASSESCSEAQLRSSIRAVVFNSDAAADEHDKADDNDDQRKKGGHDQIYRRRGCTPDTSVRRHSHSFSASSQLHPILE